MNPMIKSGLSFLKKESPLILSILGSGGVIITAVLAGKATPTAIERIESKKAEKGSKLTALETIRATGMTYGPTAIAGIATIGCILGANALNHRHQASLTSAYVLLSKNFSDYKRAVKDVYGEEAEAKVMQQIVLEPRDGMHPYAQNGFSYVDGIDVLIPETDEVLFYDEYSKRYFNATPARVLEAEYHLNRNYANRGEAALNEFYEFLGIDGIPEGKEVGWMISDDDDFYWVDFNHIRVDLDDGKLDCIVIEYPMIPQPFDKLMAE